MPVRSRSPGGSRAGSPAQAERRLRILHPQHFDRYAHVHDHVDTGLGVRNEAEADDGSVLEPADTGTFGLPDLLEHLDRPEAHQSRTSSSTLSSTTPAAPSSFASYER